MLEVTHRSSVTEDQIDHLGHMNVRYYGLNAQAATRNVLKALEGWPEGRYLIHDTYTRHRREQMLGTPLVVRSAFLGASQSEVRIHHELAPADGQSLAATFVHRVCPAGVDGQRLPVPAPAVQAAGAGSIEAPEYARPRTINLDLNPLAAAPPLSVAQERRLEVRKPRQISAEECDEAGYVKPEMALMLIWGGEVPDHIERWGPDLYEGPGGELMGWAVMESRIQLEHLPRLGTRIQSFAATIAIHERATHRLHWAFDLDSAKVLCVFEGVDVAFDTRARRTMVIPDEFRRRHEASLYEDLIPS